MVLATKDGAASLRVCSLFAPALLCAALLCCPSHRHGHHQNPQQNSSMRRDPLPPDLVDCVHVDAVWPDRYRCRYPPIHPARLTSRLACLACLAFSTLPPHLCRCVCGPCMHADRKKPESENIFNGADRGDG